MRKALFYPPNRAGKSLGWLSRRASFAVPVDAVKTAALLLFTITTEKSNQSKIVLKKEKKVGDFIFKCQEEEKNVQ